MPIYGMFATPTLGMLGQESAFSSISQNLTNMNTGGYKAQATNFKTFLGTTFGSSRDNGGLVTATRNYINQQGVINSSINKLDLAIDGRGFYVMNTLTVEQVIPFLHAMVSLNKFLAHKVLMKTGINLMKHILPIKTVISFMDISPLLMDQSI